MKKYLNHLKLIPAIAIIGGGIYAIVWDWPTLFYTVGLALLSTVFLVSAILLAGSWVEEIIKGKRRKEKTE